MSLYLLRAPSRRRLLYGGLTAIGAALALPYTVFATTNGLSLIALTYDDGAILVASRRALWRIDAEGEFERLPYGRSITAFANHPETPGTLFVAVDPIGLLRSRDGGRTWADAIACLPETRVTAMTQAALVPDTLYAALAGDGLWRSKDAGESWEFVMDRPYLGGAERDVLTLVSVSSPTGMGGTWLYAGTDTGLSRVPDCFCRWQDVTAGDAMDALATGKTALPAKPLPEGEAIAHLALSPDTPERLYAGLKGGIWASTDAGVNWTLTSSGEIDALAVDPVDPQHFAALRNNTLSVSRDGGVTFQALDLFFGDLK